MCSYVRTEVLTRRSGSDVAYNVTILTIVVLVDLRPKGCFKKREHDCNCCVNMLLF
jgi:hypothetical protein